MACSARSRTTTWNPLRSARLRRRSSSPSAPVSAPTTSSATRRRPVTTSARCRRAARRPSSRARACASAALGQAQEAAGDTEGARATLLEAAQLARDVGDVRTFALAATFAGAAGAETGAVDWTLVRLLEEAVELNGPASSRRRSFLLATLARALYFADAERRHASARKRSRSPGRRATMRCCCGPCSAAARSLGARRSGRAARGRRGGAGARRPGARPMGRPRRSPGRSSTISSWARCRGGTSSTTTVPRARRVCRLPRVRWHVTVVEAALAQLAGRLGDARRLARRAVGLLSPSRRNNVATFFGVQSFLIREEEGRLDEIESMVAAAAEQAVNLPIWRAAIAVLHANLGRTDAAHRCSARSRPRSSPTCRATATCSARTRDSRRLARC